ncbi:hypothetical protein [uncultured Paludibaculum sp.]|uniref:hypothetical protein n=1 Tax=uncultured Paludibaculum sp. TaxID=1765020 RepID=UPI002AAA7566|nr:hypothetical protein [uncultured Paludibaculum sp.]
MRGLLLGIGVAVGSLLLAVEAVPQALNRWPEGCRNVETTAIRRIHEVHDAQQIYHLVYGRFAISFSELSDPAKGFLAWRLPDIKYQFQVEGSPTAYVVRATPQKYGILGRRTFYSDESKVVREHWGPGLATATSPEIR